jgi:hypothetical protein
MSQQSQSWGYTQRNVSQVTIKSPEHPCLLRHYSQPRCSTTDEWFKNVIFICNGILFSYKEE